MATIIQWPANQVEKAALHSQMDMVPDAKCKFLYSGIRDERLASLKLYHILGQPPKLLQPLPEIVALLEKEGMPLPSPKLGEVFIYLANAWSYLGNGLFEPETSQNLAVALDFALTQILLPGIEERIRGSALLRGQVRGLLKDIFPRASAFTESLS
ncbi:MAG: hypothetical protein HY326_13865 [Chloroflexi bacterium]|nr:hypothetical protein [Chloroflexota bacterium]